MLFRMWRGNNWDITPQRGLDLLIKMIPGKSVSGLDQLAKILTHDNEREESDQFEAAREGRELGQLPVDLIRQGRDGRDPLCGES